MTKQVNLKNYFELTYFSYLKFAKLIFYLNNIHLDIHNNMLW